MMWYCFSYSLYRIIGHEKLRGSLGFPTVPHKNRTTTQLHSHTTTQPHKHTTAQPHKHTTTQPHNRTVIVFEKYLYSYVPLVSNATLYKMKQYPYTSLQLYFYKHKFKHVLFL